MDERSDDFGAMPSEPYDVAEAPTEEVAAPPARSQAPSERVRVAPVALDADGWPLFDEPAPARAHEEPRAEPATADERLPEEDVPPEREPPTEEIPTLSPDDVLEAAEGEAPSDFGPGGGDRRSRRGRRGRRGRGGRDGDLLRPEGPRPAAPAGFGPSGAEAPEGPPAQRGPGDADRLDDTGRRDDADGLDDSDRHDDADFRTGGPERTGPAPLHFFRPERLDACQRAIGYHFRDLSLLENALTHSSIKSDDRPSYERMEFLGDSVVGLVVSKYLYDLLPDCDEGELTKTKSQVVSTDGLAVAAKAVGLDRYLAVGRGLMMKGEVPRSLIADVFEGVVGAVFLDRGWEAATLYVLDHLRPYIEEALSDRSAKNYKSVLQQVAQRDLGETPRYEVLREWGAGHTREFEVVAVLGRRRFPAGRAPRKIEAEQAAAKVALQLILIERGHGEISTRRRGRHGGGGGGGEPRRGGRPPRRAGRR